MWILVFTENFFIRQEFLNAPNYEHQVLELYWKRSEMWSTTSGNISMGFVLQSV